MGGRIQDPETHGKHPTRKKIPGVPAGRVWGAELRSLGSVATGGGEQPTSRTARAQHRVRPLRPCSCEAHRHAVLGALGTTATVAEGTSNEQRVASGFTGRAQPLSHCNWVTIMSSCILNHNNCGQKNNGQTGSQLLIGRQQVDQQQLLVNQTLRLIGRQQLLVNRPGSWGVMGTAWPVTGSSWC